MTDQQSGDVSALLRAVGAARSGVEDARRAKAAPGTSTVASEQRVLLEALERYAAELARRGAPVPYRIRDEMAMYRAIFDTAHQRRPAGPSGRGL